MTEPKFTPGPWKLTWADDGAIELYQFDPLPGNYVGFLGYNMPLANADLIAAAPELYEALTALLGEYIRDLEDISEMETAEIDAEPFVIKARAALSKARGENK